MTTPSNTPTPNQALTASDCREVYEADLRARMRRGGMSGEPALSTRPDGTYRRTDLEADYQTFKADWNKNRLTSPAPTAGPCDRPPEGWRCTRAYGHDGPCAAVSAPAHHRDCSTHSPFARVRDQGCDCNRLAALSAPPKPRETEVLAGAVGLRAAIDTIIEDALNSAVSETWEVRRHAVDRILAALSQSGAREGDS